MADDKKEKAKAIKALHNEIIAVEISHQHNLKKILHAIVDLK